MTGVLEKIKKQQWKQILLTAAKYSAGCILSILIAYKLGLNYSATAGIITILSIQGTKMDTFCTAGKRMLAFLLSVVLARIVFGLAGYTTAGFGWFLFIFVFLCIALRWETAMSVNAVLVSHILETGVMSWETVGNEAMIFAIGISMGIVMNLHLRKDTAMMQKHFCIMDQAMKQILEQMSELLPGNKMPTDSEAYFKELEKQIIQAEAIAWANHHNSIRERIGSVWCRMFRKEMQVISTHWDVQYVKMRKKQCEVLYEMHKKLGQIRITPIQAENISAFLIKMAEEYHEENDVKRLLEGLEKLFAEMRRMHLPKDREEFESRAILFVFMLDIREFLDLKNAFYHKKYLQ